MRITVFKRNKPEDSLVTIFFIDTDKEICHSVVVTDRILTSLVVDQMVVNIPVDKAEKRYYKYPSLHGFPHTAEYFEFKETDKP